MTGGLLVSWRLLVVFPEIFGERIDPILIILRQLRIVHINLVHVTLLVVHLDPIEPFIFELRQIFSHFVNRKISNWRSFGEQLLGEVLSHAIISHNCLMANFFGNCSGSLQSPQEGTRLDYYPRVTAPS